MNPALPLRGDRALLRPLLDTDLTQLAQWRNANRSGFIDSRPVSVAGQAAWYQSYLAREDDEFFVIEDGAGRSVGAASLCRIDPILGSAEFGRLMVGNASDRQRGFAADATRVLLRYAFDGLHLSEVYLTVLSDNGPALALYCHLGFKHDPARDETLLGEGGVLQVVGMSLRAHMWREDAKHSPPSTGVTPRHDGAERQLRVSVICPDLVPSTYIRLLSPLRELAGRGALSFCVIRERELHRSRREIVLRILRRLSPQKEDRRRAERAIRESDVVILQRSTSTLGEHAFALAQQAGAAVIYETDDNFLAIDVDTEVVGAYYADPVVQRRFRQFLKESDVLTTSTPRLKDAFEDLGANVQLLPNSVDLTYVLGDRQERRNPLVIGYAGSAVHSADFACVTPALLRILRERPQSMRLAFRGFLPDEFRMHPQVEFQPYTEDYPAFLRTLSRVDWAFALAPLAALPANAGKTDNKYREYGACGIAGIFSDSPAYRDSVRNGETGLVVPHTEADWYRGITLLLDDERLRHDIATAAQRDVSARYSVEAAADAWEQTLRRQARSH